MPAIVPVNVPDRLVCSGIYRLGVRWKVVTPHVAIGAEDDRPLDAVFQFPHVPRPVVVHEPSWGLVQSDIVLRR
jgi:hypothetical protein